MSGVGDLNEEMRAAAQLALLVLARLGLHSNAGGVGGDAMRAAERLLAHRLDDRSAGDAASLLEPAAHRAAVDRHAEAGEAIFLAVERESNSAYCSQVTPSTPGDAFR